MDSVISQLDALYLQQLIQYQKVISQRNALLKYFALNHVFENDTLSIYNEQLNGFAQSIFEKRKAFIQEFIPIFNKHHQAITDSQETVQLVYESHLFDHDLATLLVENINKDRALQYTSVGIHKDDLSFEIDSYPIKKFGSQGQQKSFLIALKQSGVKPILLFDDIFDKLDESRVAKIVDMVNSDTFGQLFISDTHPERTETIVKSTLQSYKIFNL
jgi:DNA replication and repair protein RecF